jgi:hexosaminidase
MKKIIIPLFLVLLLGTTAFCQTNSRSEFNIIPKPVSLKAESGSFLLNNNTSLFLSANINSEKGSFLRSLLRNYTGYALPLTKSLPNGKEGILSLTINKTNEVVLGKEGYKLRVAPKSISIEANEPQGLFYGIQTLLQLLPAQSKEGKLSASQIRIPAVEITDNPRFAWRGVMLDVSRHFFPKSYIKSLIDEISAYKYNVFHWHLTDDQGWRIEIKGLPTLTEIGAWRVPRTGGEFGNYEDPQPGEKATYGGFYTQEDIREIVKYASDRYITIVPEIDIPAHSRALIASFPNLACHQRPAHVNPGSPLTEDKENVLCVANDSTYIILDKIFSQVAQLFPGEYIHLGGDEAFKGFWASDPKDQKLMQQNNLKNTEELQSFFINKASKIINSKGKKVIGWEEIMQGGLTPGTVLQSWTSVNAGIKAASIGHQVIMSPWDHGIYMDNSPIKRTYSFEPVPEHVEAKYILGAEGCLWTEEVPHPREAQRMYWPRLMALSEVDWTPADSRNYDDFTKRMEAQLPRLESKNINYSKAIYDPRISGIRDTTNNTVKVKIESQLDNLDVYYRFDGTPPDNYSPKYTTGYLTPPKGATDIQAVTYRNGKQMGTIIQVPLKNIGRHHRHSD